MGEIRALGVIGSASATGRTRTLIEGVLAGAADLSAAIELIALGEQPIPVADGRRAEDQAASVRALLEAVERAHVVAIGTPIYRASFSGLLKDFLDLVPRGGSDGAEQPLRAKPVVVAATGASAHHFLALDQLVAILNGFFACFVVPPGIYAAHEDFDRRGRLRPAVEQRARRAGRGLVEMQRAVSGSAALLAVEPQV
jgi:FMN reductase